MNTLNVINKISLVAIFVLVTACGRSTEFATKGVNIDPQFSSYVEAFKNQAIAENHPLVIDSLIVEMQDKLDPGILGICWMSQGDPSFVPKVQISKEYWSMIDDNGKQELMFHELGHCVLNRAHRADSNNGIPLSIMNPYYIDPNFYTANLDQYYHELFLQQDVSADLPMKATPADALTISPSAHISSAKEELTGHVTPDGQMWFCGNDTN